MDISDWNEYAGCPNEFWAAPNDRVLHREIPEQEELFWQEFKEGRNGKGFASIDSEHNRELLLEMYAAAYGSDAPVVRSQLNAYWRKLVITRFALEPNSGFIDPHYEEPEEEEVDPAEAEAAMIAEFAAWSDAPDTSTKMIAERRRVDRSYAEYYNARLQQEVRSDDPMADINAQNNLHQPSPSTMTPTSRKVAPADVQQFAVQYMRMSTEQLKTLLSPATNPDGPAAAGRVKRLFDDACAYGLI